MVKKIKIERSNTWLTLSIVGLYSLIQAFTLLRIYSQHQLDGFEIDWPALLQDRLISWLIGLTFIILIVQTTRLFLLEKKSWSRIVLIHFIFAVITSAIWYACILFLSTLFDSADPLPNTGKNMLFSYLMNTDKLFLLYLVTVSFTYSYYYFQRDSINKVQRSQIQSQLLETRLKVLQSQLHPHFLFNTLNSIASLMDIDVAKAKEMVADLGDLLRQVLENSDKETYLVPLAQELGILEKYVRIEKTRFSDDLEVEWQVDPGLDQAQIPCLLLQPLVENAIQHGFSLEHPQLKVKIHLSRANGHMQISIMDNGRGLDYKTENQIFHKGMGLSNTFARLSSLYGDQFVFSVENLYPGVKNYIEIPCQRINELEEMV
ncbi:MAG: histidine kinase [Saprospiraceae bacterium]